MKERHGIDVAVAFPSGSTRDAVPFVVGVALGRDIAGKLDGRMAFPHYRSVPCRDAQSKAVACAGKAPLYVAIYNDGNQPVVFDATPLIQIGRKGFFRGAGHCWLDTLQADRGGVVWVDHGKAVVPKADFVTFPSSGPSQSYNNGGAVTVLAAVCRRG